MGRDVKEQTDVTRLAQGVKGGKIFLVQDIHDDPARTDRWFVEGQFRFDTEAEARAFYGFVTEGFTIKPGSN